MCNIFQITNICHLKQPNGHTGCPPVSAAGLFMTATHDSTLV